MASAEELLSRSQRNDLFRMLEQPGAPVSDFRLEAGSFRMRAGGGILHGVYIRHDASGSYFFIHGSGTYSISGSLMTGDPAMTAPQGIKAFTKALDELEPRRARSASLIGRILTATKGMIVGDLPWDQVLSLVEKWAYDVIEGFQAYDDTPDLWAELDESRQLLSASSDNTPFTDDEQAEISRGMQQVRAYVSSVPELTADQLAEVNERLDQMEEASRRLGRKDWLMLFNGAVFSLILTDTITPTVAQRIIMLGLQGLGHLFGIGGPPVPLP